MRRLAAGDTAARIPGTRARDEIGAMARTVIVFRDTMLERERLAGEQRAEAQAARNYAARPSPRRSRASNARSMTVSPRSAGAAGRLESAAAG